MNTNQPKKNPTMKIILWTIAVIFIIALLGNLSNPKGTDGQSTGSTAAPAAAAVTKAEPATPKTWVKVAELSGTAARRSDVFHLNGGKQRLTYTVSGEYSPTLYVYLVKAGENLRDDGGFPEVTGQANGETLMYYGAGDYYLDVNTSSATWTVVVEEER